MECECGCGHEAKQGRRFLKGHYLRKKNLETFGDYCKRGHERTEENTYVNGRGERSCKICTNENNKKWQKDNPEKTRRNAINQYLKKTYGITKTDYLAMVARQNGVCAICKKPPKNGPLEIDHCHSTGRVRGLLCHRCNWALGILEDSEELLASALEYLRMK